MESSNKEKLVKYVFTQLQNGKMDFIYKDTKIFGEKKRQFIEGKFDLIDWIEKNEDYTIEVISKSIDFQNKYGLCGNITDIEWEYGFDEFCNFYIHMKDFVEEKHLHYYELDWDDNNKIDDEMDRRTNIIVEILERTISDYLNYFETLSEDEFESVIMFGKNVFKDTVT